MRENFRSSPGHVPPVATGQTPIRVLTTSKARSLKAHKPVQTHFWSVINIERLAVAADGRIFKSLLRNLYCVVVYLKGRSALFVLKKPNGATVRVWEHIPRPPTRSRLES